MSEELLISVGLAETRVALSADGLLREVEIWRPDDEASPGAVYLGRIAVKAPGLDGAFVELGLARPGFLAWHELGPVAADGSAGPARRRRSGVLRLIAAPEVIEALARPPGLDAAVLSRRLGCRVALEAEPGHARETIKMAWAAWLRERGHGGG